MSFVENQRYIQDFNLARGHHKPVNVQSGRGDRGTAVRRRYSQWSATREADGRLLPHVRGGRRTIRGN